MGKFPKTYVRPLDNEIKAIGLYDFGEKDGHLRFKRDDVIILLNKRKGSQWCARCRPRPRPCCALLRAAQVGGRA